MKSKSFLGSDAAMATSMLCVSLLLLCWTGVVGCAPNISPPQEKTPGDASVPKDGVRVDGGSGGIPETKTIKGPPIVTKDLGKGVTEVRINSSAQDRWVYFSFADKWLVEPKTPADSSEWDIAFQRFKAKSNGGISGKGGVEVAILDGQEFEAVEHAPRDGYLTDKQDSDDRDKDPDTVFLAKSGWYIYNFRDHTLKPRKRVYVLKSTQKFYYKIAFTGYYDKDGNSGLPTFKFAKIKPPKDAPLPKERVTTKDLGGGVTQVQVNATESKAWVYYSFTTNAQVEVKDPKTSKAWDLAFQRFQSRSNGGVNGSGGVKAVILENKSFEEVTQAPKDGYITDQPDGSDDDQDPDTIFLVKGGWFAYDPKSHTLAPKKRVYVIQATDGKYYKLAFVSYYNDAKKSGFPTFKWAKVAAPK